MDTHLVKITDLVKDYAKIIDDLREENQEIKKTQATLLHDGKVYRDTIFELREENRKLKTRNENQATLLDDKTKQLSEKQNENYDLKKQNEKLDETVRVNVRLLGEKEREIVELRRENQGLIQPIKEYFDIDKLHAEILELERRNENQVETIKILQDRNRDLSKSNIHKDSSFWKQREELKEENRVLRQALSDIAANLGNGSTVSVDASLPFIKELPHEVKLVCDGLRKELAKEQRTCNTLREELMNPPADVQEKVLDMLGVNKRMLELSEQYRELRDVVENYLFNSNKIDYKTAFKYILKKHDEQTS